MLINPDIFKAYDIRGIYEQEFDDDFAYNLGLAYSQFRQKSCPNKKLKIIAGRDMRLSSPSLHKSLISGLIAGGVDVLDIGLTSTPTFYFSVVEHGCDGGVLVSASHNPKEYNGFKIVKEKAKPISKETGLLEIKDLVLSPNLEEAENKGKVILIKDSLIKQVKHDLKYADVKKIKPFKIVIDPANSMGSQYFDELFKHVPAEIIKMNWELDGSFPNHEADPFKSENIKFLEEKVKKEKADLGIATDGDGDRIFFVDNDGQAVEPGIARAILCKIFLKEKPGSKIAYDIRPGKITEDTIKENGGQTVVTKVGHSLIKQQTIETGAYFAGESSGHFFLNMGDGGCYEIPMIVTLKILEELSQSQKSFAEYVDEYKRYWHSGEINVRVKDSIKKIKEIKEKYSDGQQNDLDGITIQYSDFWFNVRSSNTEPLLRLNLEARTKELMEEKRDEVLEIMESV